jgi:hypothetical protein
MKEKTTMLFQLFLAIFATHAVLYNTPDQFCFVPLLCLVCMLLLSRHRTASTRGSTQQVVVDP